MRENLSKLSTYFRDGLSHSVMWWRVAYQNEKEIVVPSVSAPTCGHEVLSFLFRRRCFFLKNLSVYSIQCRNTSCMKIQLKKLPRLELHFLLCEGQFEIKWQVTTENQTLHNSVSAPDPDT